VTINEARITAKIDLLSNLLVFSRVVNRYQQLPLLLVYSQS
jgi:hypothetical protein